LTIAGLFSSVALSSSLAGITTDNGYSSGGLNCGVFDDQRLVIEPYYQWLWDSVAGGFAGANWFQPSTLMPDLRKIGLNGMDQNPNGAGNMPPDGCYDIYTIGNPKTGDVGIIVTMGNGSWSGIANKPAGYTHYRKWMYGILIYQGKLRANHTDNWPMPRVTLTDSDPILNLFTTGPTGGWVPVNLAKFIPENSRLGSFSCILTGVGSFWVSPTGGAPDPYWKTMMNDQSGISGVLDCRVNGSQVIYVWYNGPPGSIAQLILRGWAQTEVS
jgi:hypothetical protein